MYIRHHCGNAQRKGKLRGGSGGLKLHAAPGLGDDAAGGLDHGIVDVDLGIQHGDSRRDRGEIAVAASGFDLGIHIGADADIAAAAFFVGDDNLIVVIAAVAGILSGVDFTVDIDDGASDLYVHRVERVGQVGDIQDSAGLVDRSGELHITGGIDFRVFADVDFDRVADVEEVRMDRLPRSHDIIKLILLLLFSENVRILLFAQRSGLGGDLHVIRDDRAQNIDLLAPDDKVHIFGEQIMQDDSALLILNAVFRVDDQLVQQVRFRHEDQPVKARRGGLQHKVGKRGIRAKNSDLPSLCVGFDFRCCPVKHDLGFICDRICDAAADKIVHMDRNGIVVTVNKGKGYLVIADRDRLRLGLAQFTGEVHAVSIRVRDGDVGHGVGNADIDADSVLTLAGVHRNGCFGRGLFPGNKHSADSVVAFPGFDREIRLHAGADIDGVVVFAGIDSDGTNLVTADVDGIAPLSGLDVNAVHTVAGFDVDGVIRRRSDDGEARVLNLNTLLHGQVDTGQEHIDPVNENVAVDLDAVAGGAGAVSPALRSRLRFIGVRGDNVQHKVRARLDARGSFLALTAGRSRSRQADGNVAVVLAGLDLDGQFLGILGDALQSQVDGLLDRVLTVLF